LSPTPRDLTSRDKADPPGDLIDSFGDNLFARTVGETIKRVLYAINWAEMFLASAALVNL
jgi:hypothetical protein